MKVIFTRLAITDLQDAFFWYEEQQSGLGEQFDAEVDEYLGRVVQWPNTFPVTINGIRHARLNKFYQFSIYYEVVEETVVVYAVFHARRNPRELLRRLK